MSTMSLSQTTKPKSDQLNAEDFLASSKTLTITGFCFSSSLDQPFLIYTDFDDKKPYKPNKTMRKILESVWGEVCGEIGVIYNDWNGRQFTLFRDADVEWAGKKEGGIVIGAMTNIERELRIPLQTKRGRKKEYNIKPIKGGAQPPMHDPAPQKQTPAPNAKREWAIKLKAAVNYGSAAVNEIWGKVPEEYKPEMDEYYRARVFDSLEFDPKPITQEQQPAPANLEAGSIEDL